MPDEGAYSAYKPWETMYRAEAAIRDMYRATHPEWQFWVKIADFLNEWAARGMHDSARTSREVKIFNHAHDMAVAWLAIHEDARKCGIDGCENTARSVSFMPCDAVSILQALRGAVADDDLRTVARAILA